MRTRLHPAMLVALAIIALALAEAASATTRDDARRLVVTIRGDNVSGAGVVFALRPPFVYLVTANHVVRRGPRVHGGLRVGFESWPGESFPATPLENWNEDLDLAVLRVDLSGHNIPKNRLPAVAAMGYASARRLERGAPVYPIGHPQGQDWFVPGSPAKVYEVGGFEIDVELACGDGHSGGGLFDPAWRLLGILLKTDDFVCTALSFETVAAELERWRYPIDLQAAVDPDTPDRANLAIVVVDPSGRADAGAATELAARLVQSGLAAEVLDVTPAGLSSLRRGKWPKQGLPDGAGYLLLAEMGELTQVDNTGLSNGKTARLDFDVKIFTTAGPFAAFRATQPGFGFSEARAAAAARDRAFADLVRQARERLP